MRTLRPQGVRVVGLDLIESKHTDVLGSVTDRALLRHCLKGTDAVIHTATLHKPHLVSHSRQEFVDTNVVGTRNLLDEAIAAGVSRFIFTSSTSVFGRALKPERNGPAAWITESTVPKPENIYGVTKKAAEDLVELAELDHGLPCVILRTSRFFSELDDRRDVAACYEDDNIKANEFLYRRVDIEDVVSAHVAALNRAANLGFGRYIVSATTPLRQTDVTELRSNAEAVVSRLFPDCAKIYNDRGWRLFPKIDRVYANDAARRDLRWKPRYDFRHVLDLLRAGQEPKSPLALAIGRKGYHVKARYP